MVAAGSVITADDSQVIRLTKADLTAMMNACHETAHLQAQQAQSALQFQHERDMQLLRFASFTVLTGIAFLGITMVQLANRSGDVALLVALFGQLTNIILAVIAIVSPGALQALQSMRNRATDGGSTSGPTTNISADRVENVNPPATDDEHADDKETTPGGRA